MTLGGFDEGARDYDAVLVVSFGGPEGPDEVMPFLDRVLAGRPVPPPVKARIAERYARFGGVSPINAHAREFIAALEARLAAKGPQLPVYWGNRNSAPLLGDAIRRMADDGIKNAIAYVTSVFSSYSGCRQYREDLFRAAEQEAGAPRIDKLRVAYNHPGFIAAMADRVREAQAIAPEGAALLFTAHSLPVAMAARTDYEAQLDEACALLAHRVGDDNWRLAFQSNNARAGDPWLTPTVEEALASIAASGRSSVVVAPIGFVCDHMEVVMDLDVEARACAEGLGLCYFRARTVGTHPAYVDMVRQLVVERMSANPERPYLGQRGPNPDYCAPDCCLSGRPGTTLPTVGGLGDEQPLPR
ncbi:MAG: ferrochelatase [Gammaproteobacteria bacterium]|nr:ferrochelatase [Gammaproteobacteria bacterium]MYF27702.1 ferrochelatase [Gammaproteobacteria bacterium]MYK45105.1 ferrochelatase [Gammaproteobacteria bacterium]